MSCLFIFLNLLDPSWSFVRSSTNGWDHLPLQINMRPLSWPFYAFGLFSNFCFLWYPNSPEHCNSDHLLGLPYHPRKFILTFHLISFLKQWLPPPLHLPRVLMHKALRNTSLGNFIPTPPPNGLLPSLVPSSLPPKSLSWALPHFTLWNLNPPRFPGLLASGVKAKAKPKTLLATKQALSLTHGSEILGRHSGNEIHSTFLLYHNSCSFRPPSPSPSPDVFHTFFRYQLRNGLRFHVPAFFIEVANFRKVPLNQLHPNSFMIMAATFSFFRLNNISITLLILHYFYSCRAQDSAFFLTG